jgi:hypothetical protein
MLSPLVTGNMHQVLRTGSTCGWPRQYIFPFDHSTMLHGTYKPSWRLLGLWLSMSFQFVFTGTKLVSSTSLGSSPLRNTSEQNPEATCAKCASLNFFVFCAASHQQKPGISLLSTTVPYTWGAVKHWTTTYGFAHMCLPPHKHSQDLTKP